MQAKLAIIRVSNILRRIIHPLSKVINGIGAGVLLGMMFLTSSDVCLRYLFNRPIEGAFELVELMLAVVVFFGLAYTAVEKGHIVVEILFVLIPQRAKAVVAVFTSLLSLGFFMVTVWSIAELAVDQWSANALSGVIEIPLYPITFAVAFSILLLCLVLLADSLDYLTKGLSE